MSKQYKVSLLRSKWLGQTILSGAAITLFAYPAVKFAQHMPNQPNIPAILGTITFTIYLFMRPGIKRRRQMKKVRVQLADTPNFTVQKSILKYDAGKHLNGIAIDDANSTLAFIVDGTITFIKFSSIMRCDLVLDSETVSNTERGSQIVGAAVGALLAGGVGAIIGGLSGGKRSKKKLSEIALKVVVDDLKNPMYLIPIYSEKKARTPTKEELREVDEWHSLLQVIISRRS